MTDTTFVQGTIIEPTWLQDANDHVNDKSGIKHAASKISNTPSGNISATTVQAAIDELDLDKQPSNANLTALTTAASQAEMETGTEVALRAMSPKLILDAINYNTKSTNYFHNPEMSVQQRPALTPTSSRQIGQVDRWAYQVGNASFTATAGSLGGVTIDNRQVLNATVAFTAANTHNFDQRLPAKDCWKFGDKAITVSAYVFHNSSQANWNWYIEVSSASALDNFSTKTSIHIGSNINVPTGVWTRVTTTFTPTNAQVANGLEFQIRSASSSGTLSSHNVRLKDCQLEMGSSATTFSSGDFASELVKCQRFWEKSYSYLVLPGDISEYGSRTFINSTSTNFTVGDFNLKVTKIKSPAVTIYSPVTGASGKVRNENSGADENATVSNAGENGLGRVYGTTTSAQTSFRFHFVADAEL